jgi:hypothetical protein
MGKIIAQFEAISTFGGTDRPVRIVLRNDGRIQGSYDGRKWRTWANVDLTQVTREQVEEWLSVLGFSAVTRLENKVRIR